MPKNYRIQVVVSKRQKEKLEDKAHSEGYLKLSKYIRDKLELNKLESDFYI